MLCHNITGPVVQRVPFQQLAPEWHHCRKQLPLNGLSAVAGLLADSALRKSNIAQVARRGCKPGCQMFFTIS